MKLKICLMGLLCLYFSAKAQDNKPIHPLKVGDSVPEILITNVMNFQGDKLHLSDFKNKTIILDFWATWCGSCIGAFPEDTKIQELYKDSIQFLLVNSKSTRDTKERVSLFFTTYHMSYRQLACVVEDTIFDKLFPHNSIPYLVWIKNNKVLAITQDPNLVSQNIRSIETGKSPISSIFNKIDYESTQPIFVNANGGEAPTRVFSSQLFSYKPGIHLSCCFFRDSHEQILGFQYVSQTRFDLLSFACPEMSAYDFNRIILNVKNPDDFSPDSISENWNYRNRFTYSATFPPTNRAIALKYMREDLYKYFQLKIDSEFLMSDCYVLKSAGSEPSSSFRQNKSKGHDILKQGLLRDFTVDEIVQNLNQKSKIPYLNETNPGSMIRLTTEHDDLTKQQLLTLLSKNGIIAQSLKRRLKYLVISEEGPAK
jgi:thiol-disulfide isomerase/thioredoxin